jgi:hypothetical protein
MAAQYWCFDGSSWRLIDDPLSEADDNQWSSVLELYGKAGFDLLLGPGWTGGNAANLSLWHRGSQPECLIDICHHGVNGNSQTLYADRLPDGIDLFARWAPAIYAHGSESQPST